MCLYLQWHDLQSCFLTTHNPSLLLDQMSPEKKRHSGSMTKKKTPVVFFACYTPTFCYAFYTKCRQSRKKLFCQYWLNQPVQINLVQPSPVQSSPATPVRSSPASPAQYRPASPAQSSPAQSSPASPAQSSPASPAQPGPARPNQSSPASPA